MTAKYYYIARWVWEENEDGAFWRPPAGVVGLFDLRGLVNTGEFGLFVTREPMQDPFALQIGDGTDLREYQTTKTERDAWRFLLGLTLADLPDSTTLLRDVLIQTYETCGDPDGEERFLPPTVTSQGNLEFFLGGHSLISRRRFQGMNDPAWPRIQALLHRQYGDMAAQGIEARKRLLSVWMKKYGIADERAFQPVGLNEKAVTPHTTIADDFNRANGAIGSSSEGWSWIAVDGNWSISSNQVYQPSNSGVYPVTARAEIDLSSDDQSAQVTWVSGSNVRSLIAPAVRFNPSAQTCYGWICRNRTGTNQNHIIMKIVDGTPTILGADAIASPPPVVQKITVDGSTVRGYQSGTEYTAVSPITDTAITGYLRTGILGHGESGYTSLGDDFSAADLVTSTTVTVDDATHALTSETPALVQAYLLVPADAAQALASDAPALIQDYALAVANTAHALGSESPLLAWAFLVAVADAEHGLTSESPGLVQNYVLIPADAIHALASQTVTLSQDYQLVVADAAHAWSSEPPVVWVPLLSYGTVFSPVAASVVRSPAAEGMVFSPVAAALVRSPNAIGQVYSPWAHATVQDDR